MRKHLVAIVGIVFATSAAVAIVGGGLLGLGIAGKWVLTQFFNMKPEVLQIWLPTVVTLFGGATGLLINKRFERKREKELRQQELRSRLYDPVMQTLFEMVATAQTTGVAALPEQYRARLLEMGRLLLMGGSSGVIMSFAKLQGFDYANGTLEELADRVANLVVLMKTDLGDPTGVVGRSTVLQVMNMPGSTEPETVKTIRGVSFNVSRGA